MIDLLIRGRKKLLKFLTLFSPIFTIILVYLLDIDLIGWIANFIPKLKTTLDSKVALGFTMNSSLFILLVSIIVELFKSPSEIRIELTNNSRKKDNYFDVRSSTHRPVTVHMNVKIDFKNILIKYILVKLGGLKLKCIYPHWIDCKIDNKQDLKENVLLEDKKGYFLVDIIESQQDKSQDNSNLYLKLALISNSFDCNEGELLSVLSPKSSSKIQKFLINFMIVLFFDIKVDKYKVEVRDDIR